MIQSSVLISRLLTRLLERPYQEIRYRRDDETHCHVITAILDGEKTNVMITEEYAARIRDSLIDQAAQQWDEQMWDALTDEGRR